MTRLDQDLVRRWFARLEDAQTPDWAGARVVQANGLPAAMARAERLIARAVGVHGDGDSDSLRPRGDDLGRDTEPGWLAESIEAYLAGVAAGIAGSRAAFATSDDPGTTGPMQDAMCLAAGLMAGAAALAARRDGGRRDGGRMDGDALPGSGTGTGPRGDADPRRPFVIQAAETARLAGLAATDLAVDGGDLAQVCERAARAASQSRWQVGAGSVAAGPDRGRGEMLRSQLTTTLTALFAATSVPLGPASAAPCGALPGAPDGVKLRAVIGFTASMPPAEVGLLRDRLVGLGAQTTFWAAHPGSSDLVDGNGSFEFHLHTDRPGPVVAEVFAAAIPFDLRIALASEHPADPSGAEQQSW